MGSAAAYSLAKGGAKVVAFDRLAPPHHMGSTHGHTRIIREAYYEHPLYVPLVRRSYELWADLEQACGERLFTQTGGLWVGPENGELIKGAVDSVKQHGIAHDMLTAAGISERFPAYAARKEWVGLLEHRAGMLAPEKCVQAFHVGAIQHGAEIHTGREVTGWTTSAKGVRVTTTSGHYDAERIVVAAGAWLPGLAKKMGLKIPLEIERQVSHWFAPSAADVKYSAANIPVALFELPGDMFLTMGDEGHGVKCGKHHSGKPTSPESVNRIVSDAENEASRAILDEVMPGAGGRLLDARVCLYTNTPDHHFIIDWIERGRALLLSPCSGHGFKFASGIGEIAAQLVTEGKTAMDITPFSLSRFQ